MIETLLYLAATLGAVAVLIKVTPPGGSHVAVIFAAMSLFAVLAVARHGPDHLVAVLVALSQLVGRGS